MARRNQMIRPCVVCGRDLSGLRAHATVCSPPCRRELSNAQAREKSLKNRAVTSCRVCGHFFMPKTSRMKMCSEACARESSYAKRRRPKRSYQPISCRVCGQSFTPVHSNTRICSSQCRREKVREGYRIRVRKPGGREKSNAYSRARHHERIQDPAYKERLAALRREADRKRWRCDPVYRERQKRLAKKRHADPAFKARAAKYKRDQIRHERESNPAQRAERLARRRIYSRQWIERQLRRDPDFMKKRRARQYERQRARMADPAYREEHRQRWQARYVKERAIIKAVRELGLLDDEKVTT